MVSFIEFAIDALRAYWTLALRYAAGPLEKPKDLRQS
jgi:hypothetical protein